MEDNETAGQNGSRATETEGVGAAQEEATSLPSSGRNPLPGGDVACDATAVHEGPLLVVASEFMGRGEHDELGAILMRAFFHTLGETRPAPSTIVLINSGVKLVVEGSPVVEDLLALQSRGVEVLACGTCVGYYGVRERIAAGEVSNMYTIAEKIMSAGTVVNL
jgi:selenium metabolism protein YedF